jgi:hypothetical protein
LIVAGCEGPRPRSFIEYLEDPIARDGTLARCNAEREALAGDIECANARRAAVAVAARDEAARRRALALASERKLAALRAQIAALQEAERQAAAAAEAAARDAYEAQWIDPSLPSVETAVRQEGSTAGADEAVLAATPAADAAQPVATWPAAERPASDTPLAPAAPAGRAP